MAAGKPTIALIQGQTLEFAVSTPWDLTGHSLASQVRDENGNGAIVGQFSITLGLNPQTGLPGRLTLTLPAATTANFAPGRGDLVFDIRLVSPGGAVKYLPRVWLNVSDRVTV
jgi:hypothetical protein